MTNKNMIDTIVAGLVVAAIMLVASYIQTYVGIVPTTIGLLVVAVLIWGGYSLIAKYNIKIANYTLKIKMNTIIGFVLLLIGATIIFYGYYTWNSSFQISKATNPNFLTNAFIGSAESIGLYFIGILVIIGGGLLINKERALRVMQYIAERYRQENP
jgi:drug/metabolite transporter (DMT)-like permease